MGSGASTAAERVKMERAPPATLRALRGEGGWVPGGSSEHAEERRLDYEQPLAIPLAAQIRPSPVDRPVRMTGKAGSAAVMALKRLSPES